MSQGWQVKTLGEIVQKTETVNPALSPNNEFDYIDVSSVCNKSFRIQSTQRLKGENAPSRARRLVKSNDVLFATVRPTLQRIAIVPDDFDHQVCSTGYFVLRPKPEVNHKFLFYYLFTDGFTGQMERLQKGASYPAVNDGEVKAQLLSYPPLPEQKRIVAILDEAFVGISQAVANAEKNLANARELFESYLNGVFTRKGEGWVKKTLREITTLLGDGLHGTPRYTENGEYHFINGNNLNNGEIIFKERTKRVSFEEYEKHKKNLNERTVFVSINGTLGNVAFYNNEKIILGKSACYFNLIKGIDKTFIKYVVLSPQFKKYMHTVATGATIKNVSLESMRNYQLNLPTLTGQQAITKKLDALSAEINNLESIYQQKLTALIKLKQSILQKAFTGELTSKSIKQRVSA